MMARRALAGLGLLAALAGPAAWAAPAGPYPARTVTFVVPFAAGSATDSVARFLADRMARELSTAIVVENKPGANGSLAARSVADGPQDGSVVLVTSNSTHASNANLYRKLSYDPVADFAPVARIVRLPLALIVRPQLKAGTVPELLALGRDPAVLTYGSGNASSQVAAEVLGKAGGLKLTRVPYQGNNRAIVDLMANRIDFVVADLATALPQIEAGTVRALAVTTVDRVRQIPDVPTMQEAGIRDYEIIGWLAAFARAGTPPDLVDRLNAAILKAISAPDAEPFFRTIGGEPFGSTPAALGAYVESETARWASYVAVSGIEKQ